MSKTCDLVWFDPGSTTGICAVSISPKWLAGKGKSDFETINRAIKHRWHAQVGQYAREWDEAGHKAVIPNESRYLQISKGCGPVRSSRSPDGGMAGGIEAVLAGEGNYGGGDITFSQSNEVKQVIEMQNLLEIWPDAAWGYEDFILRTNNRSRETLSPVRVFSMLTFSELVRGSRARVPFNQSASLAKTTATDERIKAAGLYRAGMPHATDAARHVATFLRRARMSEDLRAQAWPAIFGVTAEVA